MLHHQRLTSVAPPTAPPMQQRGSKKSWASNKLLLRCSLLTTALLGWHKATSEAGAKTRSSGVVTPRTPPGRQTPRALPSTKQEMAPPERHHKGILCGRALRGSSNAAPSTAHQRGTTNGSSDAAKGLQEELGIKQTAPPVLLGKHCSAGVAQSNLEAGAKTRSSGAVDTMHPAHQGCSSRAAPQRDPALRGSSNAKRLTTKSFAKHKASSGEMAPPEQAPQRDPLRPSAQGLLKCCTINGSPPWHHQRLLRCSKGAPRRAGHKQTAPPVLLGKHCSAGVAQSNLEAGAKTRSSGAVDTKDASSRTKTPRALPSTKQEMAPPERHHKGILCGRALRGSSNAAPSTAHQPCTTNGSSDAAKGLQEELGIKQTAPPVLPPNHCSAGVAQSHLRSWRQDTILRRGDTKDASSRTKAPRALPSTKQEMAPPERHHKGILCGRGLRGSSNAAPSTAHQRGTTNGSSDAAKGLQEELGIKQTAPPVLPGTTALLGRYKAILWRGASTRSSSVVKPGCLQDGKRQELCQAHSKKWLLQSGTTKGSSAAERSGAPQMLHHQWLTTVAPPTAPPMQQRGSKESWASNKLLLRRSLLTTALLGQHKATLRS